MFNVLFMGVKVVGEERMNLLRFISPEHGNLLIEHVNNYL